MQLILEIKLGCICWCSIISHRLVTCMGFTPSLTNRMDSIEMVTGGDATDFGDAVTADPPVLLVVQTLTVV